LTIPGDSVAVLIMRFVLLRHRDEAVCIQACERDRALPGYALVVLRADDLEALDDEEAFEGLARDGQLDVPDGCRPHRVHGLVRVHGRGRASEMAKGVADQDVLARVPSAVVRLVRDDHALARERALVGQVDLRQIRDQLVAQALCDAKLALLESQARNWVVVRGMPTIIQTSVESDLSAHWCGAIINCVHSVFWAPSTRR
jgi:hypothetical protein